MPDGTERDNPAKRLHVILTRAVNNNERGTVKDGWARIFSLETPDPVLVIQLIGYMLRSLEEIKIALQSIPSLNYPLYIQCLDKILTAFAQVNLESDWRAYKQKFVPDALHGLEFISDVLDKNHAEKKIEQTFLDSVRQQLEALYQEVKDGHLENDIKIFLLRNIANLLFAIRNYEVFGPSGLRDMLSQSYGSILLEQETVHGGVGGAEKSLTTFCKIMQAIHSVIVLIRDGKELLAASLPPLLTDMVNK